MGNQMKIVEVVDYAQADAETKQRMDALMAPLLKGPTSFEAVLNYGQTAVEKLAELSKRTRHFNNDYLCSEFNKACYKTWQKDLAAAAQEVGLYLGASKEILKHYDACMREAAQEEKKSIAQALRTAKEHFEYQCLALQGARAHCALYHDALQDPTKPVKVKAFTAS